MSILINKNTRVLCQGITGKVGQFHTKGCLTTAPKWSAVSRRAKGAKPCSGLPVFDTVAEAVQKTGADATMIFVPAGLHGRRDPGSGRRRDQDRHRDYRRRARARHGARL